MNVASYNKYLPAISPEAPEQIASSNLVLFLLHKPCGCTYQEVLLL